MQALWIHRHQQVTKQGLRGTAPDVRALCIRRRRKPKACAVGEARQERVECSGIAGQAALQFCERCDGDLMRRRVDVAAGSRAIEAAAEKLRAAVVLPEAGDLVAADRQRDDRAVLILAAVARAQAAILELVEPAILAGQRLEQCQVQPILVDGHNEVDQQRCNGIAAAIRAAGVRRRWQPEHGVGGEQLCERAHRRGIAGKALAQQRKRVLGKFAVCVRHVSARPAGRRWRASHGWSGTRTENSAASEPSDSRRENTAASTARHVSAGC